MGASACHATERAARDSREEYDDSQAELCSTDVVHVDETRMKTNMISGVMLQ